MSFISFYTDTSSRFIYVTSISLDVSCSLNSVGKKECNHYRECTQLYTQISLYYSLNKR